METIVASRIGHVHKEIAGFAVGFSGCDFGDIRDNRDGTHSTFEEADMSS